jgi:hypothetical protein
MKLNRIERSIIHLYESATATSTAREIQEIVMAPVYDPDPTTENGRFFAASPHGEFRVGTVNAEAVADLVLGAEYFIDISPA